MKKDKFDRRAPVVMTEIVLPSHTNALGTIFGGVLMAWIDIAGAIASRRYAKSNVVTVSIDSLQFIAPIRTGDTVQVQAQINWAGKTSMEVEVIVNGENSITGEVNRGTHAFLTFVAVDENGAPRKVPKFTARTAAEKKRYKEAEKRREARLEWRKLHSH